MATLTSGTAVQQAKKQLRKHVQQRLKQLPPATVLAESQAVLDRLFASPYYTAAQSISCYVSTPSGEVQTDSLILRALDEGKRIYIPYCPINDKTKMLMLRLRDKSHFEGLKENRWGIRELDPSEVDGLEDAAHPPSPGLDLIVVPGLAFDPYRRRLGHGRGYYDRYITQCLDYPQRFSKKAPPTVALALKAQLVQDGEEIPTNEWDRLPDVLITPDGLYK
ncbi:hypothetical protein NBRC10512_003363 [Rhodotorula toruloides]|uniref:5-formyltetrahydrofolate cyclo-ligase n=2 Tax=Rhodotorula toruloides TaxID=5286 RepID=A0A061BHC6_RHOTO|nr:5-formyltetrahydrofolate cyclo-ligase [Rhodotorula toruloides NP11]EMS24784.1 5-formyltetrahydrofolate cyclo-ligase [Rhodotorula toruloides NP11]KAJ8297243.1 putative 5-formyltetrahydrofolate cyclo-ligase [Rhodotorula toruloides]CDR47294.1 RHTO0S14e01772g1_1 [Rhodotorula toruloides]